MTKIIFGERFELEVDEDGFSLFDLRKDKFVIDGSLFKDGESFSIDREVFKNVTASKVSRVTFWIDAP